MFYWYIRTFEKSLRVPLQFDALIHKQLSYVLKPRRNLLLFFLKETFYSFFPKLLHEPVYRVSLLNIIYKFIISCRLQVLPVSYVARIWSHYHLFPKITSVWRHCCINTVVIYVCNIVVALHNYVVDVHFVPLLTFIVYSAGYWLCCFGCQSVCGYRGGASPVVILLAVYHNLLNIM